MLPNMGDTGKMMSQVQAFQELLEAKTISRETEGVTVEMNLSLKVVSVEIDPEKVDLSNVIKLEILLKNAFNTALTQAQNSAARVIQEEMRKNPDLLNFGQ